MSQEETHVNKMDRSPLTSYLFCRTGELMDPTEEDRSESYSIKPQKTYTWKQENFRTGKLPSKPEKPKAKAKVEKPKAPRAQAADHPRSSVYHHVEGVSGTGGSGCSRRLQRVAVSPLLVIVSSLHMLQPAVDMSRGVCVALRFCHHTFVLSLASMDFFPQRTSCALGQHQRSAKCETQAVDITHDGDLSSNRQLMCWHGLSCGLGLCRWTMRNRALSGLFAVETMNAVRCAFSAYEVSTALLAGNTGYLLQTPARVWEGILISP